MWTASGAMFGMFLIPDFFMLGLRASRRAPRKGFGQMTAIKKLKDNAGGLFGGALARRRAKRAELKALIDADREIAPLSYYFGPVDQFLYAFPVVGPGFFLLMGTVEGNPLSTLLGIPMAAGITAMLNRSKFVYLSRRKKGLVGAFEQPTDLGELKAEPIEGER